MNKAAMAVKTAVSAESFPEKIAANITFIKGMYKDLTDLRSAEALERKEMDLGTLRTYRTPLPQGSSDPFTDAGP